MRSFWLKGLSLFFVLILNFIISFGNPEQMTSDSQSAISRLKDSGLLRSQGLIGGKWLDAYDGKTIQVDSIVDYFTFKFFNVAS